MGDSRQEVTVFVRVMSAWWLLVSGLALARAQESSLAQAAPERLALLVGIDRYPADGGFPDLGGAVRDTRALQDVLVRRYGFRDADIVLLHDEKATHEAIVRTFAAHLLDRAGPRTEVVFFFSGHGSRVPDVSGREPDELDSTYVAHDSRAGGRSGSRDFCDDELFSLVAALCAKTSRVTVIADSCHSGGGLRLGPGERPKSVTPGAEPLDREWLVGFWPSTVPLLDDDALAELPREGFLHVAACRRDQLAGETEVPGPDGARLWRGRMSLYLVQALEAARPGDNWRVVLARCQQAVTGESSSQSVMVDGALERVLFGDEFVSVEGLQATALRDPPGVRITLEIPHGLRKGSRLEIRAGERRLGEVEVDDINPSYARARWVGPLPEDLPQGELRALETAPAHGVSPLELQADVALATLAGKLASPWVSLVGEGEAFDVELTLEAQHVHLRTSEGLPLRAADSSSAQLEAFLRNALREELHWRFLFGLGREPSSLPVHAEFRIPTQAQIDASPWARRGRGYLPAPLREQGRARAAGGELRVGGKPADDASPRPIVQLEITNPHKKRLWVAVLSVSEDRGRCVIPFESGEPTFVLEPGARVSVPCDVVAPKDWPLERPMRDRYLVLSLGRPFDPRVHERRPSIRGDDPEGQEPDSGLPAALLPPLTPSRDAKKPDSSPFGVVAVDLLVDPL